MLPSVAFSGGGGMWVSAPLDQGNIWFSGDFWAPKSVEPGAPYPI